MKTCRRTPSRGPSYNESSATPTISMSSFVSGPVPKPSLLPIGLPSLKKCVANRRFTIATRGSSRASIVVKSRPSRIGILIVEK